MSEPKRHLHAVPDADEIPQCMHMFNSWRCALSDGHEGSHEYEEMEP